MSGIEKSQEPDPKMLTHTKPLSYFFAFIFFLVEIRQKSYLIYI